MPTTVENMSLLPIQVKTLHRNLLLPLGVKYQPDIDSDESDSDNSVHVDTSLSKSSQPEKVDSQTTQAKSVKFQSELPKVGFEDEKSNVSQPDPSSVEFHIVMILQLRKIQLLLN